MNARLQAAIDNDLVAFFHDAKASIVITEQAWTSLQKHFHGGTKIKAAAGLTRKSLSHLKECPCGDIAMIGIDIRVIEVFKCSEYGIGLLAVAYEEHAGDKDYEYQFADQFEAMHRQRLKRFQPVTSWGNSRQEVLN